MMKNGKYCPKCESRNIACVPDDAHRYLANSICITKHVIVERVPVVRYVCCDCGYVEEWIENQAGHDKIRREYFRYPDGFVTKRPGEIFQIDIVSPGSVGRAVFPMVGMQKS